MTPLELCTELSKRLAQDPEYQALRAKVNEYEPDYLRIMANLTPTDRDRLMLYIAACEELEYYHAYPAYQLGRQQRCQIVV